MLNLPYNFIFGIAESDLQTVGSLYPQEKENAQKTMWEEFAKKRKIDVPLYGSQKFKHYKEDGRLLNNLGVRGYRTSISMSRTIDKNGNVNKKAIKWYRSYLEGMKKHGVEIHLCLYHWEAPEIFAEQGVLDPRFHEYFLKHTDIVLDNFSDLVDYFIPMNEIWCMSFLSYFIGIHAPGYTNVEDFFKAFFTLIELQAKIIRKIKKYDHTHKIGIVNIHFPSYIQEDHLHEKTYIKARNLADNVTNFMYSDPFYIGAIHEDLIKKFQSKFPVNFKNILRDAKCGESIDYYGVNYYNSQYIKPSRNDLGYEPVIPEGAMVNSLGWPISLLPHYPNGLTDILYAISQRYAGYGIQNLVVSENGTPLYTSYTEDTPQDDFRIFIINEHIKQIQLAIQKGAPVTGYFLWTLLDNYEWQEGYKPESAFGIVAVNKKTGKRIPKKSYFWYQEFVNKFNSTYGRRIKLS
jgi:beta-glucosidase